MHNKNQLVCDLIEDTTSGMINWTFSGTNTYSGSIMSHDRYYVITKNILGISLKYVIPNIDIDGKRLARGKFLKDLYNLAEKEAFNNL